MVSREETPFDKLSWREKEAYLKEFTQRGRKLQDQANARRQVAPPGKPPVQRGVGELDRTQARANIAARQQAQAVYLEQVRLEEQARRQQEMEEVEIQAKLAEYETKLRAGRKR